MIGRVNLDPQFNVIKALLHNLFNAFLNINKTSMQILIQMTQIIHYEIESNLWQTTRRKTQVINNII